MQRHHRLALAGSAALSAIALTDAVTHGLTGHYSFFAEDSGRPGPVVVSYLVHGLAYLALAHVLRREAAAFAVTPRVARAARHILLVCFTVLGVGMSTLAPVTYLAGLTEGALGAIWGLLGLGLLVALLLASAVLGLAVVRRNPLGVGGRVLAGVIPVVLATVALGFLAPGWAHPAYLETTINFGVALLGVGATAAVGAPRRERRARTSA